MAELGVEVDLLVNNAGFGLRGRFSDLPVERQAEMVRVNCEAVVVLTGASSHDPAAAAAAVVGDEPGCSLPSSTRRRTAPKAFALIRPTRCTPS